MRWLSGEGDGLLIHWALYAWVQIPCLVALTKMSSDFLECPNIHTDVIKSPSAAFLPAVVLTLVKLSVSFYV